MRKNRELVHDRLVERRNLVISVGWQIFHEGEQNVSVTGATKGVEIGCARGAAEGHVECGTEERPIEGFEQKFPQTSAAVENVFDGERYVWEAVGV